jgi:predicted RNA-binding protein with PUA domain
MRGVSFLPKLNSMTKKEYNDIPVFFCEDCLSLTILKMDDYNYCKDCGSTNVKLTMIDDWEKRYKQKYGKKLLQK